MINMFRKQQILQSETSVATNIELPDASLTLTRSAVLAISASGTKVTWQTQVRGQQITWATTVITIPTSGYYLIQTRWATSISVTMIQRLYVNGTLLGYYALSPDATTFHTGSTMRYFAENDAVELFLDPSIACNLNVNAENTVSESPFFHIVQMTRGTV
jgi:hypothetical protein